jgi:hypothetical protein
MLTKIRAAWKRKQEKRDQVAIERATEDAAERQAASQNRDDHVKLERASGGGDAGP